MLNAKPTLSSSVAYAAWITAAAVAHRTADPADRKRADRLHVEMLYTERRVQRRTAKMNRDNRPTGAEWRTA